SAGHARIDNFILNASLGDGSLSQVSGNVGVNIASGVGNVQNNSLAGSMTTVDAAHARTVAMVATDDNTQIANAQVSGRFVGTAALGGNTLTGATGNIGVNIAGGVGNLQHNGLAIAALNSGH
ncbi:cell wall anchor protein, partial [Burkholderia gladioli]